MVSPLLETVNQDGVLLFCSSIHFNAVTDFTKSVPLIPGKTFIKGMLKNLRTCLMATNSLFGAFSHSNPIQAGFFEG